MTTLLVLEPSDLKVVVGVIELKRYKRQGYDSFQKNSSNQEVKYGAFHNVLRDYKHL